MSSAISSDRNLVSFVLFCLKRNPIRCVAIDFCSGQAQVAARLHIRVIRVIRGEILLRLFLAKFLEARVAAERVEHGIEPKQRRSERWHGFSKRAFIRYRQNLS